MILSCQTTTPCSHDQEYKWKATLHNWVQMQCTKIVCFNTPQMSTIIACVNSLHVLLSLLLLGSLSLHLVSLQDSHSLLHLAGYIRADRDYLGQGKASASTSYRNTRWKVYFVPFPEGWLDPPACEAALSCRSPTTSLWSSLPGRRAGAETHKYCDNRQCMMTWVGWGHLHKKTFTQRKGWRWHHMDNH